MIYEWNGYFLNMHDQWLQFLPSYWLEFSVLFDLEATAFHHWHVTSVQVVMNCCTLAQSVSDCLQAACSGFLSFPQVQTTCDVNSACSTISAIVVKPIYLRKNIVFLDSVVEIYKHWNTAETLVSYSGTKSLAAEWCSILLHINSSAWGHLNPSSYCDVGRFFYGVFKFWAKLCRSLFKIM